MDYKEAVNKALSNNMDRVDIEFLNGKEYNEMIECISHELKDQIVYDSFYEMPSGSFQFYGVTFTKVDN